jgi:uncharacterized protein YheU (UPF0270 family)
MIIPHEQLSPEALQGLIEEFVTRDGTDYGEQEVSLERKIQQVRRQLEEGTAVILYDDESSSSTIVFKDQMPPGGVP